MYTVTHKCPGLQPLSNESADRWLNVQIGPAVIGIATRYMPDGLIVRCDDGEAVTWFMTNRGALGPVPEGIRVTRRRS